MQALVWWLADMHHLYLLQQTLREALMGVAGVRAGPTEAASVGDAGMGMAGVREGSTAGLGEALLPASGTREPGRAGVREVAAEAAGSAAPEGDEVMTSPTTPLPPMSAARSAILFAALGASAPTMKVLGHCNQDGIS
jgi:hypothetical protein